MSGFMNIDIRYEKENKKFFILHWLFDLAELSHRSIIHVLKSSLGFDLHKTLQAV
jgi:hypothetical protein